MKRLAAALADTFNRTPETFLWAVLATQVVLWTLIPALTFHSAPMDILENIGWGREWQLGYASHPPLQAWLTMAVVDLAGGAIWPVYLLSQVAVVLTCLPLFFLGREAAGPKAGVLAVLVFLLVFYANWPTPEFNANVVQMPVWSWATLTFWRACSTRRFGWWIAFGAVAALAVYAKYSAVILFAALFATSLAVPRCRTAYRTAGPYLAVAVATIIVVPHLVWLWRVDFLPVHFAEGRAGRPTGLGRIVAPIFFMAAQALDHLLPAVVVAATGLVGWRTAPANVTPASDLRRVVNWMAFAPYAFTFVFSLLSGYGLRDMWGAPMPIWISLAAVLWLWPRLQDARLPAFLLAWEAVFVALPVAFCIYSIAGDRLAAPPRAAWPSPALAAELASVWKQQAGDAPLSIVAGDKWAAGIVGAYTAAHPSVLTNGSFQLSPWLTPADIARRGALIVWSNGDPAAPPQQYQPLGPFTATGIVRVPFAATPGAATATLGWAVRLPG